MKKTKTIKEMDIAYKMSMRPVIMKSGKMKGYRKKEKMMY